jgi:catechol 2,3-dioxygenase-like lactoylglutathione lyase family enzyme
MLGRFHEISLETRDIRASVEFYERLGFTHAQTGETWTHPYGVLTDGRIYLGLHQHTIGAPALSFVQPDVIGRAKHLQQCGFELEKVRAGDEAFNEIALRDPSGQLIRVLEARTYSPVARRPEQTSICGYFCELSTPSDDAAALREFWEKLGFIASDAQEPYQRLTLTSDHLNLAFHSPRLYNRPMLVFSDSDMPQRLARMQALGIAPSGSVPKSLEPLRSALIEAPEGTCLLLISQDD